MHLECVRGELPPILPRHGALRLRSPLLLPSASLFSSSPVSLSLSLWHHHHHQGGREEEGSLFPCFFGSSSRVNQDFSFFASFVVVVYFFFPFLTAPVSAANSAQVSWGSIYQKDIEPDHGAEDYGRSCYYYLQISPGKSWQDSGWDLTNSS